MSSDTSHAPAEETRDAVERLRKQRAAIALELEAQVTQFKMAEQQKHLFDEQLQVLREFLLHEAPETLKSEVIDANAQLSSLQVVVLLD